MTGVDCALECCNAPCCAAVMLSWLGKRFCFRNASGLSSAGKVSSLRTWVVAHSFQSCPRHEQRHILSPSMPKDPFVHHLTGSKRQSPVMARKARHTIRPGCGVAHCALATDLTLPVCCRMMVHYSRPLLSTCIPRTHFLLANQRHAWQLGRLPRGEAAGLQCHNIESAAS